MERLKRRVEKLEKEAGKAQKYVTIRVQMWAPQIEIDLLKKEGTPFKMVKDKPGFVEIPIKIPLEEYCWRGKLRG